MRTKFPNQCCPSVSTFDALPREYGRAAVFSSGRGAVIVVEHPAQALSPPDCARNPTGVRLRTDDSVRQTLVVPFVEVMTYELGNGSPQRPLPKRDQAVQTEFLNWSARIVPRVRSSSASAAVPSPISRRHGLWSPGILR